MRCVTGVFAPGISLVGRSKSGTRNRVPHTCLRTMADNWISITDAAAQLSAAGDPIDRSTLSRYLKQHAEALPVRSEGRSNLVDMDALIAHRAENVRIRSVLSPPTASAPTSGHRFKGSQSEGAARKAQADAEMREMDLAERRGELTIVSEVDKSARDAVALMQSSFDRAIDTESAAASVKYGWDERIARLILKSFARKGMDIFHREILKQLDSLERAAMAADQGDDKPVVAGSLQ